MPDINQAVLVSKFPFILYFPFGSAAQADSFARRLKEKRKLEYVFHQDIGTIDGRNSEA
jgi:hypothetical protein